MDLPFAENESVVRARERLEDLTGLDLGDFILRAFQDSVDPFAALTNLERWLRSTSNPSIYLEQFVSIPALGRMLVWLLGASQPLANTLIQNPELASLFLDRNELGRIPQPDAIALEGEHLLAAADSYRYVLDRLRYLRQRWNLPIAINDLFGRWDQETVWRVLSDLADVLVDLTADAVWREFARGKAVDQRPEFMIVAFGKLGGRELNYSSDVDLVYVSEDGLEESKDRDLMRFFEAFGRALTDRMGRGSLYRVDLRLRPYGGAGPIVRSMKAYEAYYRLYAEPWEVQALLRSRPLVGSEELRARWSAMRETSCFRPKLTEMNLERMLAMKTRIEESASDSDIKRGEGGIRDVEFLVQILQLLHGHRRPDLQVMPTCDAIRALDVGGLLEPPVASALIDGYTFLRKLEHRAQLVGDLQTHSIPEDAAARHRLAKLMGYEEWAELERELQEHRRTIQVMYRSCMNLDESGSADRADVLAQLGSLGPAAVHWFDALPESEAFYDLLIRNRDSLQRVRHILAVAPRLVAQFRESVSLTELLMSGEIEEVDNGAERIRQTLPDSDPRLVATLLSHAHTTAQARWVLSGDIDLGDHLSRLGDALIFHCIRRLGLEFDVVGLGSFGMQEMGPSSDLDLLLIATDRSRHQPAEGQAERLLSFLGEIKRLGAPVSYDLRLRPEGSKGLLVRTLDGFRAYDAEGMEEWERFALGHARLVHGSSPSIEVVRQAANRHVLSVDSLEDLLAMKQRIETERLRPELSRRDLKLGAGCLNDLEWTMRLLEMKERARLVQSNSTRFDDRVSSLFESGLLGADERTSMLEAHRFLLDLRYRVYLLGINGDILPDAPEKLDRLAESAGLQGGNSLLARYHSITASVRRMYLDAVERVRA
ncbi:MAG: hypothetical protein P4L46_00525 [Fimbriimonas sp.]|nr:hypothetical protein [Fimbriimonas sp.]